MALAPFILFACRDLSGDLDFRAAVFCLTSRGLFCSERTRLDVTFSSLISLISSSMRICSIYELSLSRSRKVLDSTCLFRI